MCAKSFKVSVWCIPLRSFHEDRYEVKYLRLSCRHCSERRVRNDVEILTFYMRTERREQRESRAGGNRKSNQFG
jgi:hypothetical protein